jgi:ribose transport system substrate-binding protein
MNYLKLLYFYICVGLLVSFVLLGNSYYQSWKLAVEARNELVGNREPLSKKQVVLITEQAGHPYWDVVISGARKAAGNDIWIDVQGPNKASSSDHIRIIERAIASHVDGIITQGLDHEFIPVINKAIHSGIPVITLDTDAPESERISFVGTDNYDAGYQAGQYVKKHFKDTRKIGIISGSSYGGHMTQRIQGFKDAIHDEVGLEIVSIVNSQINKMEAMNQTFKMLNEHPEINLMFGVSALDGPGIAEAIDQYFPTKGIPVVAFDDLPETLRLLQQGKITAIIAQRSFLIGNKSIELMRSVFQGKSIPQINHTEIDVVEKFNVEKYSEKKKKEEGGTED